MKLIFSPLIAGMSGKAADAVAASWKGVPYVRKFVIPHNPKSDAQVVQRGYFARMSPWFRSLPTAITDWLDDLAVGQRKSGYNLMTRLDLKHLADAETPGIVPGNPECNALFSVADGTSVGVAQLDVDFVAGSALATHYVAALTCPVDPAEDGLEEPDGWTLQATPVLVSAASYDAMAVLNSGKDYYVVLLVIDTATLVAATIISGGVSCIAASAPL